MNVEPGKKNISRAVWILIGCAALAAGGIAGSMFASNPPPPLRATTVLQVARPLTGFQLLDQDGRSASLESFKGRWTLLFAGFTSCPNICPSTLTRLRQIADTLPPDLRPRVMLLSVDPERDTPARLKQYLAQFDPAFVGLTGDPVVLRSLRTQLGLIAEKSEGAAADGYTVDHSASLVLINPRGEVAGYLSPPFDVAAIADDLRQLAGARG